MQIVHEFFEDRNDDIVTVDVSVGGREDASGGIRSLQGGLLTVFRLHRGEDVVQHLVKRRLGRRLIDQVPAGQVDFVAGPDDHEQRVLVHPDVGTRHDGQQGLENLQLDGFVGVLPREAVGHRLDEVVVELTVVHVVVDGAESDVSVGDELLHRVQRG